MWAGCGGPRGLLILCWALSSWPGVGVGLGVGVEVGGGGVRGALLKDQTPQGGWGGGGDKAPFGLPEVSGVPGRPLAGWGQNLRGDLALLWGKLKGSGLGCCLGARASAGAQRGCPGARHRPSAPEQPSLPPASSWRRVGSGKPQALRRTHRCTRSCHSGQIGSPSLSGAPQRMTSSPRFARGAGSPGADLAQRRRCALPRPVRLRSASSPRGRRWSQRGW